jgi:hypothetical protein
MEELRNGLPAAALFSIPFGKVEKLSREEMEQVTTSGGQSSSIPPFLNFSIRDERSEESHV